MPNLRDPSFNSFLAPNRDSKVDQSDHPTMHSCARLRDGSAKHSTATESAYTCYIINKLLAYVCKVYMIVVHYIIMLVNTAIMWHQMVEICLWSLCLFQNTCRLFSIARNSCLCSQQAVCGSGYRFARSRCTGLFFRLSSRWWVQKWS